MTRKNLHLFVAVLCAAPLASCVTHGGNDFIVATKVIPATAPADPADPSGKTPDLTACAFDAQTAELLFPTFSSTTGLRYGVVLDNRLPTTGSDKNHFNPNDFVPEKVTMNYETTSSTSISVPETTSTVVAGTAPAGAKSVIRAELVPAAVAPALAAAGTIRIHFYITGRLLDGTTVKSSDYEFVSIAGAAASDCVLAH